MNRGNSPLMVVGLLAAGTFGFQVLIALSLGPRLRVESWQIACSGIAAMIVLTLWLAFVTEQPEL